MVFFIVKIYIKFILYWCNLIYFFFSISIFNLFISWIIFVNWFLSATFTFYCLYFLLYHFLILSSYQDLFYFKLKVYYHYFYFHLNYNHLVFLYYLEIYLFLLIYNHYFDDVYFHFLQKFLFLFLLLFW